MFQKIKKWFKELLDNIDNQCPHCGYYCHGKSAFCTPPIEKDVPKNTVS